MSANAVFSSTDLEPIQRRQRRAAEGDTSSISRLIVQTPQRDWRQPVQAKLEELMRLPEGWDGYRGVPVSFDTANFAVRMMESICRTGAPVPQIVPGSSGDVQIEWHTNLGDIELHVRRANSVHAWRRTDATGPEGDQLDLDVNFLPIVSWIEELSEPIVDAAAA